MPPGCSFGNNLGLENNPETVIKAIKDAFEDAPEDQVAQDVIEFINELLTTGFIGEVE